MLDPRGVLGHGLPSVLVNKPIAGCLDSVSLLWTVVLLQLVRALVAIPLVATGGIGTGAAIAGVLVPEGVLLPLG